MTGARAGPFEVGHLTNGHYEDTADARMAALCRSLADVLRVAPATPSRISLRCGTDSLEVEWPAGDRMVPITANTAVLMVPADGDEREPVGHQIRAPLVGTFYRAPEPGAKAFVEVGDLVEVGQQVGIVEAMKLMNAVEADRSGRVTEIRVGDAEPVEYDQPLLVLAPLEER